MIARRVMRHRCSTVRDAGSQDNHGAKAARNWQAHLSAVPCCAYYKTGSLQQQPEQKQAIETLSLLLPVGTDVVSATDRIGDVTNKAGVVLFKGPLVIEGPIVRRSNHLELTLRQVS